MIYTEQGRQRQGHNHLRELIETRVNEGKHDALERESAHEQKRTKILSQTLSLLLRIRKSQSGSQL